MYYYKLYRKDKFGYLPFSEFYINSESKVDTLPIDWVNAPKDPAIESRIFTVVLEEITKEEFEKQAKEVPVHPKELKPLAPPATSS